MAEKRKKEVSWQTNPDLGLFIARCSVAASTVDSMYLRLELIL